MIQFVVCWWRVSSLEHVQWCVSTSGISSISYLYTRMYTNRYVYSFRAIHPGFAWKRVQHEFFVWKRYRAGNEGHCFHCTSSMLSCIVFMCSHQESMCYVCDGDWKAEVQSAQEPSFVLAWCVDCVVYLDLVTTVFYFISLARFYLKVCRSDPQTTQRFSICLMDRRWMRNLWFCDSAISVQASEHAACPLCKTLQSARSICWRKDFGFPRQCFTASRCERCDAWIGRGWAHGKLLAGHVWSNDSGKRIAWVPLQNLLARILWTPGHARHVYNKIFK